MSNQEQRPLLPDIEPQIEPVQIRDNFRLNTTSNSFLRKALMTILRFLCIPGMYFLLEYQNIPWIGNSQNCTTIEKYLHLSFCSILVLRSNYAIIFLWSRPPAWIEILLVIPNDLLGIYVTFAAACREEYIIFSWLIGFFSIVGYILSSAISTYVEYERAVFKQTNPGELMTSGLWGVVMHVNYTAEFFIFIFWALLSRIWWSFLIPVWMLVSFRFWQIPGLHEYLLFKYGESFTIWSKNTWRMFPYIY